MSVTVAEIVAGIDQRLADARQETARLQRARAALAPAAAARPRPRRRRRRAAVAVVSAEQLTGHLAASDGMTTAQLADATGGDAKQLLGVLKAAESDGGVRRTGTRRATRWYAVTDEDRIAARAAELEASRRSAQSVA